MLTRVIYILFSPKTKTLTSNGVVQHKCDHPADEHSDVKENVEHLVELSDPRDDGVLGEVVRNGHAQDHRETHDGQVAGELRVDGLNQRKFEQIMEHDPSSFE